MFASTVEVLVERPIAIACCGPRVGRLDRGGDADRRGQHRGDGCGAGGRGGQGAARVKAPSTLGTFLRAFTFGHVRQLGAVAAGFLVALAQLVPFADRSGRSP
jgi:hypothetical protein